MPLFSAQPAVNRCGHKEPKQPKSTSRKTKRLTRGKTELTAGASLPLFIDRKRPNVEKRSVLVKTRSWIFEEPQNISVEKNVCKIKKYKSYKNPKVTAFI